MVDTCHHQTSLDPLEIPDTLNILQFPSFFDSNKNTRDTPDILDTPNIQEDTPTKYENDKKDKPGPKRMASSLQYLLDISTWWLPIRRSNGSAKPAVTDAGLSWQHIISPISAWYLVYLYIISPEMLVVYLAHRSRLLVYRLQQR